MVKEINWIKIHKSGKLAKSTGHYFQHATEVCIVAVKNMKIPKLKFRSMKNGHCIHAPRQVQSQKPDFFHKVLEDHFEKGNLIELFGRSNNLRDGWKTLGFQVLPNEKDFWIFLKQDYRSETQTGGSIVL